MTLTLLLQLTDEEQLFAANTTPVLQPQEQTEQAPAMVEDKEATCAQWPSFEDSDC